MHNIIKKYQIKVKVTCSQAFKIIASRPQSDRKLSSLYSPGRMSADQGRTLKTSSSVQT